MYAKYSDLCIFYQFWKIRFLGLFNSRKIKLHWQEKSQIKFQFAYYTVRKLFYIIYSYNKISNSFQYLIN